MLQGNAIVGQSGGPTSVINSSLCGVVQGCFELGQKYADSKIDKVFGMQYGVEGFMQDKLIEALNKTAGKQIISHIKFH